VLITVPHSMPYWSKADEFAGHYRRFEFQEFRESLRQCALVLVRYFTWGFRIAYFYYQAVTKIEPARLMCSGESRLRAFAARMLYHAMKIDDLFTGKRWHQLIALARKDSTTAKRRW